MTYEEFKQLAEHPQHRDVPAIFKLEVLETEELEERKSRKKRRRKTGSSARLTIAVSATRNRLRSQKSAVVSSAAKSSRHPKSRITSLMSRLQPNVPSVIPTP